MNRSHYRTAGLFVLLTLLLFSLNSQVVAQRKPVKKAPPNRIPDLKSPEDKRKFLEMIRQSFPVLKIGRGVTYRSEDLDEQLEKYIARGTSTPFAQIIDDETFARRAWIDATGHIPPLKQFKEFVASKDPKKREKLIDRLLETDDFARKQARYWTSVIFYNSNANKNSVNRKALENWLFDEFKAGTGWDRIVGDLVSATPTRKKNTKPQDNGWNQNYGPNNFILANERKPELIASSTARIFMGISIECAECHDHPFDNWKREQFHEMAAFFAPGNYYMTDQYDPSKKSKMEAKFLLGEKPPAFLKPDQRRVAGAAYLIYNPDNYWFARAYVNRVWNELIGDGFYAVDSLGQDKEVVHQLVANRIAASFRYAAMEPKWLFRVIMNSRAYQRQIATIDNDSDLFTSVRPARMRPYEVADNLTRLVGENQNLVRQVMQTFAQNPSIPQRDLEGEVQQALLMMNNPALHNRLKASQLKKNLLAIKDVDKMVKESFYAVLSRSPTEVELADYRSFIKQSGNRSDAVDDLLWVLVNSAEFVTKR